MNISISLAQIHVHLGSPQNNLSQVQNIIENLRGKTEMLLLPELWTSSYLLKETGRISQENIAVLDNLQRLASDNKLTIGGSLLYCRDDGNICNTFHIIGDDGKILASYDKLHLFRLMDEHKWMSAGTKLVTHDLSWGKVGLAICYDLRFPELFREYALMGCKAILLVAEWPMERIEHWKILLQARAIENQFFIAAVNSVGQSGSTKFGGNSMIIDPWGNILSEGSRTTPEILTAVISPGKTAETRKKISIFEDRRFDIYGND